MRPHAHDIRGGSALHSRPVQPARSVASRNPDFTPTEGAVASLGAALRETI